MFCWFAGKPRGRAAAGFATAAVPGALVWVWGTGQDNQEMSTNIMPVVGVYDIWHHEQLQSHSIKNHLGFYARPKLHS